jgi:hypothetical protein
MLGYMASDLAAQIAEVGDVEADILRIVVHRLWCHQAENLC